MNDIMTIGGIDCYEKDGTAYLKLEAVARGLGFTETASSGNECVRWRTVRKYLSELGIATSCDGDKLPDFIPENIFYRLAMKAKNEAAEQFQAKVADEVIPSIRKHGAYMTSETLEKALEDPDTIIRLAMSLKAEKAQRKALEAELDRSKEWYSIKRVARKNGVSHKVFDWRRLKEASEVMGHEVRKIFDANYGEVNVYHQDVWEAVYPCYEL